MSLLGVKKITLMCVHTDPHFIHYKKTLKKSENSDICKNFVVDSL